VLALRHRDRNIIARIRCHCAPQTKDSDLRPSGAARRR
jgi:hypothetical protein